MKPYPYALAAGAALVLAAAACAQVPDQVLKSFGNAAQSGSHPVGVIVGADGALYGTTAGGGIYSSGTVFRVSVDGSHYAVLHSFGAGASDGATPQSSVVQGRDGMLYGTTSTGGTNKVGTVFRLAPDGSSYAILHTCESTGGDGKSPAELIQGADGVLYGVAQVGGTNSGGAVFRLGTDGSGYAVLYSFGSKVSAGFLNEDGVSPVALTQGDDGALYGVTQAGGTNGLNGGVGVVFKLRTDGSSFAVLHTFGDIPGDGANPVGLAQGGGLLVGATQSGGSSGFGVVFTLSTDGSGYALAHHFVGKDDAAMPGDGASPGAGLLRGADGSWYGTTLHGGTDANDGVAFQMSGDGSKYQIIRRFTFINSLFYSTFSTDGQQPGPLAQGPSGMLYGTTAYGGTTGQGAYMNTGAGTVFALSPDARDYSVVCNFSDLGGDGGGPVAGLTLGRDGALYGVTPSGGPAGQGSVFKIRASGAGYSVLYGFGLDPIDGYAPKAGLMQGTDGILYGAARRGGYWGGTGAGSIFKINPDGSDYTVVLSFGFYAAAGVGPTSAPLQGRDGVLYGTTADGGNITRGYGGLGIIYAVGTNGLGFKVLHEFSTNYLEGHTPYSGLIQGGDGALYGTAYGAGTIGTNDGGTVYKLRPDGGGFQVLHTFASSAGDGKNPYAGLILGADGFLYGTTQSGGTNGSGTVFKLSTGGAGYQVIHSFGSVTNDGNAPVAPLAQGSDGYLYGTTPYGGAYGPKVGPYLGYGVAFRLDTSGAGYAVLHSFGETPGDGRVPQGGLIQGPDGAFYGTTSAGGNLNAGTVFRLGPAPLEFTAISRFPDKTVSLSLSGAANVSYRIETSDNLVSWVTLTNVTAASGSVQVIDASANNLPRRFYRAVLGL